MQHFNEAALEQAVLRLFEEQGYTHTDGATVVKEPGEVLLQDELKAYLLKRYAREKLTVSEATSIIRSLQSLPASTLYESNRDILRRIADGFSLKREDPKSKDLFVRLIDFDSAGTDGDTNSYRIVSQLEIHGYEKRIPDAIVYINGLPLVVIEFKSAVKENTTIHDAWTQLTVRYRRDIPELFKYNALCVISDGVNNKAGTLFAPYKFFYAWRKVEEEDQPADGIPSLRTMVQGLFDHHRLTDVVRNFIYFPDTARGEEKILCRYPQYYAANKLFRRIQEAMRPAGNGKGGTYFGATGSGKSYTMLYLARLLMRSPHFASPTIVLITDRTDLDDQLSGQFTNAKTFIGDEAVISVESREELKALLRGRKSGGVFLTTIHKFEEGIGLLSERSNIICISDEAHRSQINLEQKLKYTAKGVETKWGFAKYLHDSLPCATYVGFTGTPVDGTLDVFGEVVDAYTMKESVDDNITVKIVYEGRAAKVTLNEKRLYDIEHYYTKVAEEGVSAYQIEESKKAVTSMEVILGDPKRVKLVAADFVQHYETRVAEGASVLGKAMFVSSNRYIAWAFYKEVLSLRPEWNTLQTGDGRELTEDERKEIKPAKKMQLVMTRAKDDPKELYDLLGTKEGRKELDRQFKQEASAFKIAIVVDMWLTGFDVPALDTIYIDKPLQQHSLIQTISRVNRVYENKDSGLVVDYFGMKKALNLALAQYSKVHEEDFADVDKAAALLRDQLDLLTRLFHGFDERPFFTGDPLARLDCLNRAAEWAQQSEDREKRFMAIVKKLRSAYDLSCSSELITAAERDYVHFYLAVRAIIYKLTKGEAPDTAQMNDRVREMIKEALISDGVEEVFKLDNKGVPSGVDIFSDEYLAKIDKIKLPNTKIKLLQQLLAKAIEAYKKTNRAKGVDFSKRLRTLVMLYNERKDFQAMQSDVLDDLADQFAALFKELQTERESFKDLGIDFEEKAFYDILEVVAAKYDFAYPEEKLIALSKEVKSIVDDKAKYADWAGRADIKAELKVALILTLAEHDYPPVPKDEIFKEIFEQAEHFKKHGGS